MGARVWGGVGAGCAPAGGSGKSGWQWRLVVAAAQRQTHGDAARDCAQAGCRRYADASGFAAGAEVADLPVVLARNSLQLVVRVDSDRMSDERQHRQVV